MRRITMIGTGYGAGLYAAAPPITDCARALSA